MLSNKKGIPGLQKVTGRQSDIKSDDKLNIRETKSAKFIKELLDDKVAFLIITPFLIYIFIWSYISITKFYALNDNIFDLGISMQRAWSVLYVPWTLKSGMTLIFQSAIVIFFSPVALIDNYPFLLFLQTLFLAATIFPLYGIAKRVLPNKVIAFAVSSSYLFYFPLAGINWFDFHYQSFFVFLFIFAYYLYVSERKKLSVLFFILSGTVRFPYVIFPILFSLIELLSIVSRRDRIAISKNKINYLLATLIISIIFLIGGFITIGGIHGFNSNLSNTSMLSPFTNIDNKVFVVISILSPLLFIPLLSKKWIIFYIPFFYLIFYANYVGYFFPQLFHGQYFSGIVPFLYLGSIDALSHFTADTRDADIVKVPRQLRTLVVNLSKYRAVMLMLIVIGLFAMVYQPYGPLNHYSSANFDLKSQTAYNLTAYNEISYANSLIPKNQSNVLFQSNLPQFFPRSFPPNQPIFMPTMPFENATIFDAIHNSFPMKSNGSTVNVSLDYAVADVTSYWYYGTSPSMFDFLNSMYHSGKYGILLEGGGIIVLKRGYAGPVLDYHEFQQNFPAKSFVNIPNPSLRTNIITVNNFSDGYMWHGPWTFLIPGKYQVEIYLSASQHTSTNIFYFNVTVNDGSQTIGSCQVNGTSFKSQDNQTIISMNFTVNSFYRNAEFLASTSSWKGQLSFYGASLIQRSPNT